ncbi:MAG: hypothetical protein ABMB14_26155, partial [Myxococcota bacterium]
EPRSDDRTPAGMFGTPPPLDRSGPADAADPNDLADLIETPVEAEVVFVEDDDEDGAATATIERDPNFVGASAGRLAPRRLPQMAPIADDWLTEAIGKAEGLLRSLPPQATLELSREPNLPFTLVISRATPATAVRAMVMFVEFLAGIATPPRARIELAGVAHLDRSFHKNVEAALEPYFGANLEVRPGPGQVDIRFTDPDPVWAAYPRLPIAR